MDDPSDEIHITLGQNGYVITHTYNERWGDNGSRFKKNVHVAKSVVELCDKVNWIAFEIVHREFEKRHSEAAPQSTEPPAEKPEEPKRVDPVGTWIRRYGTEAELHEPKEATHAPAPGPEESPKTP